MPPDAFAPDESIVEAMQAWGAPPEEIEAVRANLAPARPEPEAFGVYADNWPTVTAFYALRTQWDRAGMDARRSCLPFDRARAWVETYIRPRRRWREVLHGLHVMEQATLQADHEQRETEER